MFSSPRGTPHKELPSSIRIGACIASTSTSWINILLQASCDNGHLQVFDSWEMQMVFLVAPFFFQGSLSSLQWTTFSLCWSHELPLTSSSTVGVFTLFFLLWGECWGETAGMDVWGPTSSIRASSASTSGVGISYQIDQSEQGLSRRVLQMTKLLHCRLFSI